ncbi:glycoside hydrolase family 16 protein [Kribbella sp. NPDC056861]|uniref:glycoside hydrolase family 16 protein n=1 Tax=Kribbella sp. NPDC056861 TaxID=3154857 RepID=UPI00343B57F5
MTRRTRLAALGILLPVALTAALLVGVSKSADAAQAGRCGTVFDDFSYGSTTDRAFAGNGWSVRTNPGGPGAGGWSAGNVSIQTIDGQRALQLSATTDGTSRGTTQAEVSLSARRFFEGTYATRFRFSDRPVSGNDGDHVNQTFFAISPLARDWDPKYSELDFSEYLPNGGWGTSGQVNYITSWNTYQAEPFDGYRRSTALPGSHNGWHDLLAQVSGGHVKYFIDGKLVADHSDDGKGHVVYPRQAMGLSFNQWFIDLTGHSGGRSTYTQAADWVYYAKNEVVTPAEVGNRVRNYRSGKVTHVDDLSC